MLTSYKYVLKGWYPLKGLGLKWPNIRICLYSNIIINVPLCQIWCFYILVKAPRECNMEKNSTRACRETNIA